MIIYIYICVCVYIYIYIYIIYIYIYIYTRHDRRLYQMSSFSRESQFVVESFKGRIGEIALIEVLSLAHALLFQFSYTARSVLSAHCSNTRTAVQMCRVRVSHVNTVGYGLSERKQVGEN